MPISNKLSALAKKETVVTFKEVKKPENAADDLTLFESNSSAKAATANEWTIDVFPDQIPPSTYIMKLASDASAKADHKDNSKSSLATFCLYYMTVFQAFFLLNDLHVRPSPSSHASTWSNIKYKSDFAEYLLTLPVPEALIPILLQLASTQTDKTKNVFFIPSAAGFHLSHFFGRFIPLSLFTHIHDCIATMPGNSSPVNIYKDLLPRILFSYPAHNSKKDVTVADILGYTAETTTATYVTSKWHQTFSAIFNPVLFRDFHRRSSLATLDMNHVKFTAYNKVNAYDAIFNATPHNIREMKVVLQHVSSVLNGTVPIKQTLSQVLAAQSGISALVHGYSTFALPTWTANSDTTTSILSGITAITRQDTEERAAALTFLQIPAARTPSTEIEAATGTNLQLKNPWSLINLGTTSAYPADKDFIEYDDQVHPYPKVLVLDPTGDMFTSAHLATLTGKIIETFEIDGTAIAFPNPDRSLAMQNCQFFDSAIPMKNVFPSLNFRATTTAIIAPLARRHVKTSQSLEATSLLHDKTTLYLPHVATQSTSSTKAKIVDDPAPTGFPGLTVRYTEWIKYAQSFLSFASQITDTASSHNRVVNMEDNRLYVWSPYTYTSHEDEGCDSVNPDLSQNVTYFLTNLRTLFGTDAPMYELVHPMEAMPV